jgi:hypothetical protein
MARTKGAPKKAGDPKRQSKRLVLNAKKAANKSIAKSAVKKPNRSCLILIYSVQDLTNILSLNNVNYLIGADQGLSH